MQKFIIGTDNFGIGKTSYKIDKENSLIIDLTIIGDDQLFGKLSENEDGEWNWALNPPELYLKMVPYKIIKETLEVAITEEILNTCDVALYFMKHNDIIGKFTIDQNHLCSFKGVTFLSGQEKRIEIEVNLTIS